MALGGSLSAAASGSGDLDPLFGRDGVVFAPSRYEAFDVARQGSGKLLVGGHDLLAPYPDGAGMVARYRSDGSPDRDFGADGIATTPPRSLLGCQAMAVAPDGAIVCVGTDGSEVSGVAARYRRDGALDPSFGSGGLASAGEIGDFRSVAVQADGGVLAASSTFGGSLASFTAAGELDPAFDGDGIVSGPVGAVRLDGAAIALQSDGNIITTGYDRVPRLVRLEPDGTLDPSFGRGGVSQRLGVLGASLRSIAVQADGKIVVVGRAAGSLWLVARFGTEGRLDRSFGDLGLVVSKQGGLGATDVGVLPDGRIAVCGRGPAGSNYKLVLYGADGIPDPAFGNNGKAQVQVGARALSSGPVALVVQRDGKVVLAGNAVDAETEQAGIALVRFLT
jgi:uncharacterized delta-60 repeat protein